MQESQIGKTCEYGYISEKFKNKWNGKLGTDLNAGLFAGIAHFIADLSGQQNSADIATCTTRDTLKPGSWQTLDEWLNKEDRNVFFEDANITRALNSYAGNNAYDKNHRDVQELNHPTQSDINPYAMAIRKLTKEGRNPYSYKYGEADYLFIP